MYDSYLAIAFLFTQDRTSKVLVNGVQCINGSLLLATLFKRLRSVIPVNFCQDLAHALLKSCLSSDSALT